MWPFFLFLHLKNVFLILVELLVPFFYNFATPIKLNQK